MGGGETASRPHDRIISFQTVGTYTIIYTRRINRSLRGPAHGFTVSLVSWSGNGFVSSSLTDIAGSGERPRLSSAPLFWRLKRVFVSADHCETPALPSALTRTYNRHTIYPNTMAVEIHIDKAARRSTSTARNAPTWTSCQTRPRNPTCRMTHQTTQ
jgi:hypothetical protein